MSNVGFRSAMSAAGLSYAGPIHADGKLHRFRAEGDSKANSWYVLFPGPPQAGAFGCWKRGINENWCEKHSRQWNHAKRVAIQERWAHAEKDRQAVEARVHAGARTEAESIFQNSTPASARHPYLASKGVKPFGDLREHEGRLVLPLRDANGVLHSLQRITRNGIKLFLRGGRIKGCYFTISDALDGPLVIVEGYATGASIHEATGFAVVCAINCGNLLNASQALRAKWRDREIIIAADDDRFTDGNPGLNKATEAARAVGAKLAVPQFKDDASRPTDFNDLHQLEGINIVKRQIDASNQVAETEQESFERLAKLSPPDYDRCRAVEAARLRIRPATLDSEVARRRSKNHEDAASFATNATNGLTPWDAPVSGAQLLTEIEHAFCRFCCLPAHASAVLAAWVLQTYCYRLFDFAAIIAVWSPEPECGKGRVLDVTEAIALNPFRTANTSAAVLYHSVSKQDITVLVDELDSQRQDQRDAIGNVLKQGFQSSGTAHRIEERNGQRRVVEFATFSPKMVASIGLETLDKATRTRSISIRMSRKPRDARIEKFRRFDATETRRKCLRWVQDNLAQLKAVGSLNLDECATDRQEDVWEPLVTIARIAGGDWESRIREAARNLSGVAGRAASESAGHQLLTAIRDYFANKKVSKVGTKTLIEHLTESGNFSDHNYGRGLTPTYIAKLLKPYNISPRDLKMPGGNVLKGYDLGDFNEAFAVYLGDSEVSQRNSATEAENIEDTGDSRPATKAIGSVPENSLSTNKDGAGSGVADAKAPITRCEEETEYV